jgi:hypothetical protein
LCAIGRTTAINLFSVKFSFALVPAGIVIACCYSRIAAAAILCRWSFVLPDDTFGQEMAPRDYSYVPGDQLADRTLEGNSRPMMWLESEKKTEWKNWLKENPTQHATFEDWKALKHTDGLALYYAALRIWEESDSSVCLRGVV